MRTARGYLEELDRLEIVYGPSINMYLDNLREYFQAELPQVYSTGGKLISARVLEGDLELYLETADERIVKLPRLILTEVGRRVEDPSSRFIANEYRSYFAPMEVSLESSPHSNTIYTTRPAEIHFAVITYPTRPTGDYVTVGGKRRYIIAKTPIKRKRREMWELLVDMECNFDRR